MQDEQPFADARTMEIVQRYQRQLEKTAYLFFSHAKGFNTTYMWKKKLRVETDQHPCIGIH